MAPGDAAVFALGHSTRTQPELVALLRGLGVATLADIRTVPRSRHNPQFNREVLAEALPQAGLRYVHLARLGGLRKPVRGSAVNAGWRNESFRGYADHMQTADFEQGLAQLLDLAREGPVAIMCAEAVPWRCHRSLVADALLARGVAVQQVTGAGSLRPHRLTPFARVEAERVTYPAPPGEAPAPQGRLPLGASCGAAAARHG